MDTTGGGHYQIFQGYESRRCMSLCLFPLQSKVGLGLSKNPRMGTVGENSVFSTDKQFIDLTEGL